LRFVPVLRSPRVRDFALKAALYAALFVLPTLALILFHLFLKLSLSHEVASLFGWRLSGALVVFLITIASALVAFFALDINMTGPHRLYRDRLANTFVRLTSHGSSIVELTSLNRSGCAPYHLINAAVNLPASVAPPLRDRRCDFFLFSKNFCGSPSSGYAPTPHWRAGSKSLDIATAMAVSGAAVAPNMGLGSYPTLRALLTLLNVRLSYWIRRPHAPAARFDRAPGFECLLREMTGIGMSEDNNWLNLSDGGHIENMGVYELLRRRCKFILCVDGEQDGDYHFQGLMTVARHAQIDFGIRMAPLLDDLRPDPKIGFSAAHFAFSRIGYPEPGAVGLFLYLKLSLTGNEGELIKRYKIMHPDFPHQSTLDQFFDQEQFEMYRRLGVHVAEGLFGEAITGGATHPTTFGQWYRSLAESLLEPSRS
jgi:hypothetical protein